MLLAHYHPHSPWATVVDVLLAVPSDVARATLASVASPDLDTPAMETRVRVALFRLLRDGQLTQLAVYTLKKTILMGDEIRDNTCGQ